MCLTYISHCTNANTTFHICMDDMHVYMLHIYTHTYAVEFSNLKY